MWRFDINISFTLPYAGNNFYFVQSGDTCNSIEAKYSLTWAEL